MPLEKLNSFTKDVSDLPDRPLLSAADLKAHFDAAPHEVRTYLNKLIDQLQSVKDGDSGADNIKATSITGVSGNTVQAILEDLKKLVDNVPLGKIPDGTLTDAKLSNSDADIKKRFAAHKTEYETYKTGVNNKYNYGLKYASISSNTGMQNNYIVVPHNLGITPRFEAYVRSPHFIFVPNKLVPLPVVEMNGGPDVMVQMKVTADSTNFYVEIIRGLTLANNDHFNLVECWIRYSAELSVL